MSINLIGIVKCSVIAASLHECKFGGRNVSLPYGSASGHIVRLSQKVHQNKFREKKCDPMRPFEVAFLTLFTISFLNLVAMKSNKAGIYLSVSAIITCLVSKITEGYRSHIVPALILTALFLVYSSLGTLLHAKKIQYDRNPHRILKIATVILLIPVMAVSVALPLLFPVVHLPEADGPYQVGTRLLSFTDPSRHEQLSPVGSLKSQNRKIPVQVWYPAADTFGKRTAKWVGSVEAINLFSRYRKLPDLFDQLPLVKTHSFQDTLISDKEDMYPVILFSGGSAMFNGQNVVQMEELASHGYVVFSVGHPYEDFACVYPDGTMIPYNEKRARELSADTANALKIARQAIPDENDPEFSRAILRNAVLSNASVKGWSADMRFVADMVADLDSGKTAGIFKGKLDVSRIGAFGHSFGGAAAGQLCLEDSRIKAFINMDGSPFGDAPDKEIQQPFMILTHGGEEKYNIRNGYSPNESNFIIVQIEGAKHMNFSDFNSLMPVLGRLAGFVGKIGQKRQMEILNSYLLNFFDRYLKDQPAPLLDAPVSKFKEVTVIKR